MYIIDTWAGGNSAGDGRSALSAALVQPQGIVLDGEGNLYVADAGDHRVRRIAPDGRIYSIAGTGTPGYRGDDGPAAQAQLNAPYGLALDKAGNLYIADLGNAAIRRIGRDGKILTVAGGGSEPPSSQTAVVATDAKLHQPRGVAVDLFNNLYIADFGAHVVYQVTAAGSLTVIAGTGEPAGMSQWVPATLAPLSYPAALAVDASGGLYIADSGNHRVRRLSGGLLSTVTDRTGVEIELGTPTGLAFDAIGTLYMADGATRITTLSAAGELSSVAIGGTAVALSVYGEVYAALERQIVRLRGVDLDVVAGSRNGPAAGDGQPRSEWRFHSPSAIISDVAGYIFIADAGHGRVRWAESAEQIRTLTTDIASPVSVAYNSRGELHVGDGATGAVYRLELSGQARLVVQGDNRPIRPAALAFDVNDNLYIADSASNVIRMVEPDGSMTIAAGGGNQAGDGPALLARLSAPAGLAFDLEGGLWFTESATGLLRRLFNGDVTTLAGPELKDPRSIRIDNAGNLFVADAGNHRVFRIAPGGDWAPVAGSGDRGFSGDNGLALSAMLNSPTDVLPQADGSILIADTGNNRIRRLRLEGIGENPELPPPGYENQQVTVLHAGTLKQQPVAPGQIVYLEGSGLSSDMRVLFGDAAGTILDATKERLTVQVPWISVPGTKKLSVVSGSIVRATATIEIVAAAPAVLTAANGSGAALALNQDGSVNGPARPAGRGSTVVLFLTGEGAAPEHITADISGYPCTVIWSGRAPDMPGVFQINLQTPGGFAPSGIVPLALAIDGVRAQTGVTIVSR